MFGVLFAFFAPLFFIFISFLLFCAFFFHGFFYSGGSARLRPQSFVHAVHVLPSDADGGNEGEPRQDHHAPRCAAPDILGAVGVPVHRWGSFGGRLKRSLAATAAARVPFVRMIKCETKRWHGKKYGGVGGCGIGCLLWKCSRWGSFFFFFSLITRGTHYAFFLKFHLLHVSVAFLFVVLSWSVRSRFKTELGTSHENVHHG